MIFYNNKRVNLMKGDKRIVVKNTINEQNVNELEYPYIATRYITPTVDENEDVILNFYVTDWNQSEIVLEDSTQTFDVEIILNDVIYNKRVSIGENSVNVGKLSVGEYQYLLQATDKHGRKSHQLYNEFRVIDAIQRQIDIDTNTHIITNEELNSYGIVTGDYSSDKTTSNNNKLALQKLLDDLKTLGVRKAILPTNTYTIDVESHNQGQLAQKFKNPLFIPSNFILDLNASIINHAITDLDQRYGMMIAIRDCNDSHVINGTIQGDYGLRDISNGVLSWIPAEQMGSVGIFGNSKYSSFDNLTIKDVCGYSVVVQFTPDTMENGRSAVIYGSQLTMTQGDIDNLGNPIESTTMYTSQFLSLGLFSSVNTIRTGQWLGYIEKPHGDSVIVRYHWYDENYNFIKTTIGHQWRDILKPNNAKYLKCTYEGKNYQNFASSGAEALVLHHPFFPRNCDIKNIAFENHRTCALAPYQGNNILIDNCTFDRCGQGQSGNEVTPIAIDFEDGWANMQDYCLQNCEITNTVGTADIAIVGGFDLLIRKNKNFRLSGRGFSRGIVYDNNEAVGGIISSTHRLTGFNICRNNDATNGGLWATSNVAQDGSVKLVMTNCIFAGIKAEIANANTIIRDCTFEWNSTLQYNTPILRQGIYHRCAFNNFTDPKGCIANNNESITFIGCAINNANLLWLNGELNLINCTINNMTFGNQNPTTLKMYIDNCTLNGFIYTKNTTWHPVHDITIINSTIDNAGDKILKGGLTSLSNTSKITIKNNTFLNGTLIASDDALNDDIVWDISGNINN